MMATFTTKGWLYCVTSPEYEKQGIYKCGYTTKGETKQEAEQKLMTRYGTSWILVILSGIVSVSTPHQAEQEWFEKMKEYRLKKEFFKLSISHIIEHMNDVAKRFPVSNHCWTELQKNKYLITCSKIIKSIEKEKQLSNMYYQLFDKYQCYELINILSSFYNSKNIYGKGYIWLNTEIYFKSWMNGTEKEREFIHEFCKTK